MLDRLMMDRRRFLRSAAAAGVLGGALASARNAAAHPVGGDVRRSQMAATMTTTPIRPPATPLIVRTPYLSSWQTTTSPSDAWPSFWNGDPTGLATIVRVDGTPFILAGQPSTTNPTAVLAPTSLELTATRSIFTFAGGGVQMTLEYLSPIEPGDLQRQSIPMAWVLFTVHSVDGAAHEISLYVDVTGEWLSGDPTQQMTWAPASVSAGGATIQAWTMQLADQEPLTELHDRAQWGTMILATPKLAGLTVQSGSSENVRTQFVEQGSLLDADDSSNTSIGGDGYPAFAFALDFGRVDSRPRTRQFSIGHVRTPVVSFLGSPLAPLWSEYFPDWQHMLAFFHGDLAASQRRADALDARVSADARRAGGTEYEALCVLSLRQAYAATELALGPDRTPWAVLKEISSNGDMSTVDVIFPAAPVWIYLDPQYLSLLLRPVFAYAASGHWNDRFAPHDIGIYPNGLGWQHVLAEKMPVEESGDMLIMAAAYMQAAPGTTALVYLQKNYRLLKQWADYLVSTLPNIGRQNQTDDFAGEIAHSVNLALKGIVAVAAMGQIAEGCGEAAQAAHYRAKADQLMGYWLKHAQAPGGRHLGLTYRSRAWGNTYNAYADALLGTGLVPDTVAAEQAVFYRTKINRLGLPLQTPHRYGKSDWQLWLAAWLHRYPVGQELIHRVYRYADTVETRIPFNDLYDTVTGERIFGSMGFEARPVQGGIFALLALRALTAARAGGGPSA